MKLIALIIFLSTSAHGSNLEFCKNASFPSICVGEEIMRFFGQRFNYDDAITGVYEYYKGHSKELKGTRKIIVTRSNGTRSISYYGSDGDLYTTFTCELNQSLCISKEKHLLTVLRDGNLFVDWKDDSNGFFKLLN